eukprot:6201254-Pleurochrysis_carterae.AAC.4
MTLLLRYFRCLLCCKCRASTLHQARFHSKWSCFGPITPNAGNEGLPQTERARCRERSPHRDRVPAVLFHRRAHRQRWRARLKRCSVSAAAAAAAAQASPAERAARVQYRILWKRLDNKVTGLPSYLPVRNCPVIVVSIGYVSVDLVIMPSCAIHGPQQR